MTAPKPFETPVTSVVLSSTQITLAEGASVALQATARDEENRPLTDRSTFWSSSDTSVARVSSAGVVTAVRAGSAQIAVSIDGRSAVAQLTVSARAVASVQITPLLPSLLKGNALQLTARTLDDAGGILNNRVVSWGSSDVSVAVVDVSGLVTGVAAGVATVTATSESRSAAVGVTVLRVPVASVVLSPPRDTIVLGQSTQFTASVRDSAGGALDDPVLYASSALGVATVSSSGLVLGVSPGTTTITATAAGRSGSSTVVVQARPVGAVIVSPSQAALSVGQAVRLTVQITDAGGNLLTGRPVEFRSNNVNIAQVAADGTISAIAPGTAIITITSEGKTGTANVTVSPSPIASLRIAPTSASLLVGASVRLTAEALDASGNVLGQRPISWTSGSPTVVSVSGDGTVAAVGAGSALVFALAEGRVASASIVVTARSGSTMAVDPTAATVIAGQSRDLTATLRDGGGAVITGRAVQWTSSNNAVAVVSSTGRVRGVAPGTSRIDAVSDGTTGSSAITIVPVPIASVTVSLALNSLLVGQTTQASAIGRDSIGTLLTGRAVVWSSSNPAVATVSSTGLVTAVALGTAIIRATSEGVTGASTLSVVVGVASTIAGNSLLTQSAPVGDTVNVRPSVRVTDAAGTGVAGVSVSFSVTAGAGTIAPASVLTNATGVATLTSWTLGTTAGINTVTAVVNGLTGSPVTFSATGLAGAATQLALTRQPAGAVSGDAFTTQPIVAIRDASGNLVSSTASVTVAIQTGAGVLGGTTTVNAVGGLATFTNLQLTGLGTYTLRFTSTGLTGVTSASVLVTAGIPSQLTITTQPGGSSSGLALITQPVIALRDVGGNLTNSSAAVTASIASGGGTLSGTTTVNAVNGVATFTNLALSGVGSHTLRFASTGLSSVTSTAVIIGEPTSMAAVSIVSQTAVAGTAVAAPPSVRVADAANVGASGVDVTFAVTSGGGAISTTTVTTNASGVATLASWTLGTSLGVNTVRAAVSGLAGSPVTFTAQAIAGAPTQIAVTTQPAGAASGVSFTTQPVVVLRDVNGNQTTSTASVTATIATGSGTLGGTVTVNAVNGVATFTNLSLSGLGNHSLRFASGALPAVTSNVFAVVAGPPALVAITTQPSGASSGLAFTTQPVVEIRDATGNLTSSGASVTATIASGSGTIGGTATVTAVNGVATFTTLAISGNGPHTLTFASTGLTSATSASFVVSAATTLAAASVVTQSATAGTAVATPPSVRVSDAANAPVGGVVVTFAVTAGGGSIAPATVTSNASGIATLTSWTLGTLTGANTVTATVAGLTGSPVSFTATGTPGAATQLVVRTQPAGVNATVPFATQPAIELRDANNNLTTSTASVTATVASGNGALSGTTTINAVNGVATFTNLSLTGGGTHTLRFASTGLSSVVSAPFVVSGAATISANSAVTQSATAGNAVATPPSVFVADASNNGVPGVTVTFAVTAGGGTIVPAATVVTNASGIATLTSWTLGTTAGANTVTATVAGLSGSPVTFNATGTAGAATTIAANSVVTQSAPVNTVVAAPPSVRVVDANNNPVSGVTVTFAVTAGAGTRTPATVVTNASGIATLTSWTLGATAGANTVTATAPGLTGSPVTFNATGTTGAATTIAANSVVTQSAPVNTAVAAPPSVRVSDAGNNPVSGVTVTFAVTAGAGTRTPATVVTNASGIATLTSWTLGTTAGANTVTATAAGLTGSPVTFNATGTTGAATTIAANSVVTQSATVNTAVAAPPSVLVTDASSNPVSGVTVTFAVTAGAGTRTPATVVTNASGIATLTSWTLGTTAGANTVTATAAGLTGSPVTFNATGTASAATTIAANSVVTQSATVGTAVAAPPSVRVSDAGNNPVSGVTVTFAVTAGAGTRTPATVVTNASGIATLTSWTLGTTAGANTVTATAAGLTGSPVTFNATGTAGAATTIAANSVVTQSATVSTAVAAPPSVRVVDANNNPVSGVTVTFAVTAGAGTRTPATVVTNASGIATLTSWTLGATAGANTVTATAAGLTGSPVTFNATGTAGAATTIAANSVVTQSATVSTAVAAPPSVRVTDASNNPVSGVTVTFAVTAGAGTRTPATVVTNASGIATLTSWVLGAVAGANTLSATATGLTGSPVLFSATGTP